MKRVLLTGASGFIGRHCIAPLIARGYEVHAVSHTRALSDAPALTCHRADLLDPRELARLLSQLRPTHLLHLAWYADPRDYRTSAQNLAWCQAGVDLMRRFCDCGGRRALFAGTCFEYDPRYGLCTEELTPEAPATLYAVCKDSLRRILAGYAPAAGLSAAWARIFYLYGPFEPRARLVPSVILSLLGGDRAGCTHGGQLRDFLHVEDVASALVATLDSPVEGAINIGSGDPVSVRTLVETIARLLEASSRVDFGVRQPAPTDAPVMLAAARRLRDQVKWRPRYSLEDGLASTIRWWKENAANAQPR